MLLDIFSFTSAIPVGPHVQDDFDMMRFKFTAMFIEVIEELTTNVELERITKYLWLWNRDLRPELASVQTVGALSDVIRDYCSFTNYSILTALARYFKNRSALNKIKAYTEERDEYYQRVLAEDFARAAMQQAESIPNGHITVNHCLTQLLTFKYRHNYACFRSHLL